MSLTIIQYSIDVLFNTFRVHPKIAMEFPFFILSSSLDRVSKRHGKTSKYFILLLTNRIMGSLCPLLSTRLSRNRLTVDIFRDAAPRQSGETMTSLPAGHIVPTPIQPIGSGRRARDRTHSLLTRNHALYPLIYRVHAKPSDPSPIRYTIFAIS